LSSEEISKKRLQLQQTTGLRVPVLAVAAENWIESSGVGSCNRELD
jgi:hypothetical protein